MAALSLSGGERDGLGKQNEARATTLALLSKPMEADRVASDSPLLGLPLEILVGILDLIANDRATLAALALVNSDCRQLARSCQFAEVCFIGYDNFKASNQLLRRLLEETPRIRPGGSDVPSHAAHPPFIGPCIRRVTVHPCIEWLINRSPDLHNFLLGDAAATLSDPQFDQFQTEAVNEYITTFRIPVLGVLKEAMPNLEALSWVGGVCLDATFFLRAISHLPIRHLTISSLVIGEPTNLEALVAPTALPLESLSFGASACTYCFYRGRAGDAHDWASRTLSPFITALLRSCRTTLKYLHFGHMSFYYAKSVSFGRERILFPRLRHLSLSSIESSFDATAWSSLFSAPLRRLVLPLFLFKFPPDPAFRQALSACQPFRNLEALEVPYLGHECPADARAVTRFISRHPHLQALTVSRGATLDMDSHLLPCLSDGRWSNLTSLSLAWEGPSMNEEARPNVATIDAASLAAIGKIESLEQLHLSAGIPVGWRYQWLIDHDVLRSSLGGLSKLKRLAFSRDTYDVPGGLPFGAVEGYYEYPVLPLGEVDDVAEFMGPESVRVIWERVHRGRMIREADKYVALLPGLEWIYCGEWPMDIRNEQTSSGAVRSAVPLGEARDSCTALLRRMFSLPNDDYPS